MCGHCKRGKKFLVQFCRGTVGVEVGSRNFCAPLIHGFIEKQIEDFKKFCNEGGIERIVLCNLI